MKVTFENATIADSIQKASRVAPTKGSAFDKAAGILMTLDSDANTVSIRATDLDIFYLEVVDAVEVEGNGTWRFPSQIISGILSKLPIGSGKQVSLEEIDYGTVSLKSGRTTAKLRTMDASYFPTWEPFDPDSLETVSDLGARIQQVEWAALSGGDPPLSGIHLNGEFVVATDRIRMALAPCEASPIYKPITIPSGILSPVMRTMRDVAIGLGEGHFNLMPDASTQIKTVIFDVPYPPIERAIKRGEPSMIKFRKNLLLEMIDRAMVFGGADRSPMLTMYIGSGELAVMMSDQEQGLLGDIIDVPGYADHKRVKILFTPKNLTDAINAAPSEQIELHYNPEVSKAVVRIDGGSGYEAWVMPRRELGNE
jgi:DNA polymerase III sliding clamp (beta) subunit (PCNA family)